MPQPVAYKNEHKGKKSKRDGALRINKLRHFSFFRRFFYRTARAAYRIFAYLCRRNGNEQKPYAMQNKDCELYSMPDGPLADADELEDLLGPDYMAEAYQSVAQVADDLQAEKRLSATRKAARKTRTRLSAARKRLDEKVAELARTEPTARPNPYLTEQHQKALLAEKAAAEADVASLQAANEALSLSTAAIVRSAMEGQPLASRAATLVQDNLAPAVARLLASLNMNLDLQLNGKQTEALMAALLTCNENQLRAIHGNPKVPIAVKIMARRLMDDVKAGSTAQLESLWDRIFGKGILDYEGQAAKYKRSTTASLAKASLQQPASPSSTTTINIDQRSVTLDPSRPLSGEEANRLLRDAAMPDQPLSREAYLMIRDRFFGDVQDAEVVQDEPADQTDQDIDLEDLL